MLHPEAPRVAVAQNAAPGPASASDGPRRLRRLIVGISAALIAATATAGCGGTSPRSVSLSHTASSSSVVPVAPAAPSAPSAPAAPPAPPAPRPPSICKARAAIARVLGAAPSVRAATANSSYPECIFRVRVARRRVVVVTVEVDIEPSAYAVLERTIEEQAQIFPTRTHPAPQHVGHLGLDASWFPEEQQLQTTDAVRLVIVTIDWPSAPTARKIALAVAAARPYLGRSKSSLARGPAP